MKFWKKALLTNLIVVVGIVLLLTAFFISAWGNPIYKTLLLTTEVVPDFPVKPIKLVTSEPKVEEIRIRSNGKEISASLYRPRGKKQSPAMIVTLGVFYTRDNVNVVKFANSLARVGFVVLVPDFADLLAGYVRTDSVEILVSSVEYLNNQPFVDSSKIGLAGFCVGGSVSIVAAEDPKVADKIAYVAAVSPYFDFDSLTVSTLTRSVIRGDKQVSWEPANLTVNLLKIGYLNYLEDIGEKQFLIDKLKANQSINQEELGGSSDDARVIHEFLANSNRERYFSLRDGLPDRLRKLVADISPSANMSKLRAKVLILNDKKDTFVPKEEGRKFAESLPKNQVKFVEIDSFEHVNPATKLERWAAIRQVWHLGRYLYEVLSIAS